jgi:diamine N-acetyltransferase
VFQKTPEKVTITLEQLIADQDIFNCFVAETIDKEIVGFATYFYSYHSWSGKGLYLDDLYVKENFRNLSVGKQLLNTVINFAKDQNCKKVRWVVSNWNANAIEFYKKIGATVATTDLICDLTL